MIPTIKVQTTAIDRRLWRIELDGRAVGPVFDSKLRAEAVATWLEEAWEELP